MSLYFNQNEIKAINFNGVALKTLNIDGVTVWKSFFEVTLPSGTLTNVNLNNYLNGYKAGQPLLITVPSDAVYYSTSTAVAALTCVVKGVPEGSLIVVNPGARIQGKGGRGGKGYGGSDGANTAGEDGGVGIAHSKAIQVDISSKAFVFGGGGGGGGAYHRKTSGSYSSGKGSYSWSYYIGGSGGGGGCGYGAGGARGTWHGKQRHHGLAGGSGTLTEFGKGGAANTRSGCVGRAGGDGGAAGMDGKAPDEGSPGGKGGAATLAV